MKVKCVTGAPGAGKSTYVKENKGENDIIFDYDLLAQAVTGKAPHSELSDGQQHVINRIRYDLLRAASDTEDLDTFWMIAAKPSDQLMEALGDECEYINLDVDADEAKRRIDNDDTRQDKEAEHEKVDNYFRSNDMIRNDREYRNFSMLRRKQGDGDQPDYKVRGYASTFERYLLWSDGQTEVYERIDPEAFDEADMGDVIFLYNHEGMVYARKKNGTLSLSTDEHGLFTEADLSSTQASRDMYDAIQSGLIDQMSFAFTVKDDEFDRDTNTRIIHRIGKVYDVSAVSIPANPGTDIAAVSARSYFDGVVEAAEAERLRREKAQALETAFKEFMEVINER